MCGIMGYTGSKNAAEQVYEGLKRLEYRGYDSAGIATSDYLGKLYSYKRQGRVENLLPALKRLKGNTGIGHTRWATHGKPSDKNAHPHSSGKIVVVHNGIIENYAELKEKLLKDGEIFYSETDSEVVAKLVNKNFDGNLLEALQKSVKLLKGSYALMAMCEGGHTIAIAKYKSPVILGYGEKESFCASDMPALAGKCEYVSVLEDGDFALLSASGIDIYDINLNAVKRQKIKNTAVTADLDLCGYPHYMLKELNEVPASVRNTVAAFPEAEEKLKSALAGADRVIIVGCGTAYHAGLIGKRYFESFAHVPAEAETAGEFRYKNPVITPSTVVFAVSQSGETADTVEAARLVKSLGAKVVAVTNSPCSQLTRIADVSVPVAAGAEICVAATKSYTGQIAALYLSALTMAGGRNRESEMEKLKAMPEILKFTLEHMDMCKVADLCAHTSSVYFLGRDLDYAVALEGSLKLKEVSYVSGEGFPASEIKHGPLALIDENTVSVFLIFDEALADKSGNAVNEVITRGGKAVIFTDCENIAGQFSGKAQVIVFEKCDTYLTPLLGAVAVQMLAYRTAVLLNKDPDKPRNLAKSVTVE